MMAEHPDEVQEITKTAGALLLNLGNITDTRLQSIQIAAKVAQAHQIPFVLDLVGIACSGLRRKLAQNLITSQTPTIIKGNYSEIQALYQDSYKSAGVDADNALTEPQITYAVAMLAKQHSTTVLASGKTDIITDGKSIIRIHNGTPQLASVTGTGCMLGALCACYTSVADGISAAKTACAVLGISGQLSETDSGCGSFMLRLMDKINTLTDEYIDKHIRLEETQIENL